MTVVRSPSPLPAASPPGLGGYGGPLSLAGFVATLFLFVWGTGALIEFVADASLGIVLLIAVLVVLGLALVAFEFAHELPWSHPLRRAWASWDTVRRTALESLVAPAALTALLAVPVVIVFEALFATKVIGAAFSGASLAPFASGEGLKAFAAALAVAAGFVAVHSLAQYLVAGRAYLTQTLAKFTPQDPGLLATTPVETLRHYHRLLRLSGAAAFAFELVFQILAFGVVTWGVATALPELGLFARAETATLPNAILYWLDRVFALVDGQNIFGFAFSPLEPNKAVWPFGFAVLFFKLFAVAMIIRLFQDSLNLRPRDISLAWGNALERDAAQ